MGLGGGSEVKAELRQIAPNACKVVVLTRTVAEAMKIEAVIADFDAVFYPIISSTSNVSAVGMSASKFLDEMSEMYACTGEIHMLFEGKNVPIIKQMVWENRKKDGFSEEVLARNRKKLEGLMEMPDIEAVAFAGELLGEELEDGRNCVKDMMGKLMKSRIYRATIRKFWVTTLQEAAYRRTPFKLVELIDAPYTKLSPPRLVPTEMTSTKRQRVEVEDTTPCDFQIGAHCYISWDENGSRNRSITAVPEEKTGEGEAKIPEVILRCFNEGKKSVLVKSRDSDAIVYILMMMRDLIDPRSGNIGITVYLDMGVFKLSEPGVFIINMTELYRELLRTLSKKYPHLHNPIETWLTSRIMAGCDYLDSPKGWGIMRFMTSFEAVGHVILAHAVTCSRKVSDPQSQFIKLDEERFLVYMRLVGSVNWPAAVKSYADPGAADGKQEVRDEMNDTNFRTMPKKQRAAGTNLGHTLMTMVHDGLQDVKDEVGCFDELVLQMFDACPSQGELIEMSIKKRNESKAKTEQGKPDIAWNDSQIRAYIRRLCYIMFYFRHSPYGWEEDPLAVDEETGRSKWGWRRDPQTNKICISDLV